MLGDNQKASEEAQFITARPVNSNELFGGDDAGVEDRAFYEINSEAFETSESYRSI